MTGPEKDQQPGQDSQKNDEAVVDLSKQEQRDVEERVPTRAPVIFEIVRRMGEEEINRPWISLWWSGIAAGLSMGFSILSQAFLKTETGSLAGGRLIEKFGYCVGFILVILSRQQLFTENTLTSVVPLLGHFNLSHLRKLARLWSTVFVANMVGTFTFALLVFDTPLTSEPVKTAALALSLAAVNHEFFEILWGGIGAGFLIASLVWILASVDNGKLLIIIVITYIISIGGLAHVVAGSVECWLSIFSGNVTFTHGVFGFLLPAFIGNVIGGTFLFAMLVYGQTHQELIRIEGSEQDN